MSRGQIYPYPPINSNIVPTDRNHPACPSLNSLLASTLEEAEIVVLTIDTAPQSSRSALLETAGAWKGLVDPEAVKQDIYASRMLRTRAGAMQRGSDHV
jgi:hypothetical protein